VFKLKKRVLFVGDQHSEDKTPKSRKDDYLLAILKKLEEIVEIAKTRKVDAIVLLGDLFHKMEPSGKCRNSIISLFLRCDIPIYVTLGNHDIKNSLHNLPNSALGTLIETGVVQYIEYSDDLSIYFGHYHPGIEEELKNGEYADKNFTIYTFHANIADKAMMFEHVLFSDVKVHPNCKLVVAGHIHRQMDGVNDDGVIFQNPGSICRNEMNDYNLHHMPGVFIVEYEPNGDIIRSKMISLESAQSSDDIFRIDEITEEKDNKADTKKYMQQITKLSSFTYGSDKYISLKNSGQIKQIEPAIIDIAVGAVKEINAE
jgi:DNA repair exonuclease SbcCD nuclease subunit